MFTENCVICGVSGRFPGLLPHPVQSRPHGEERDLRPSFSQASRVRPSLTSISIRLDGKKDKPMHSKRQSLTPLFRTTSLAVNITLAMAVAIVPARAQNSVPPTAVQAAKMPEFASRLAHPVRPQASRKAPGLVPKRSHLGPLQSNDIYDNGPTNGNTDAWTINFGVIVSDTFNVANNNSSVTAMSFAAWIFPGDVLSSAEVSITSGENGGTSYFDQTVNFTQGTCTLNQYGYNVCTETTNFNGPNLNNGTYWVNLQNASVPSGDQVYWDENSGPSSASQNEVGTIPSESFTILGSTTTTTTTTSTFASCPPFQNGFSDIYDFTSQQGYGPSGMAIDSAGNFYGSLEAGGSNGEGLLYKLAEKAGNWILGPLYSFLGGGSSSANTPGNVLLGPQGALYGVADGGIQNCGNDGTSYCGLVYEARPASTACLTALCSWTQTILYEFTGNTDAWGGTTTYPSTSSVFAFDSVGDLYGVSTGGGAYGYGAVFELTSSLEGWTEKILYSFRGGSDGANPNSLLLRRDGDLYGTASGGGNGAGVVFQLVPSGGMWTDNVIHALQRNLDGWSPGGLIEDNSGNLYGFDAYYYEPEDDDFGQVYKLSPSGGGWSYLLLYQNGPGCSQFFHQLAFGASGDLYGAEGGYDYGCGEEPETGEVVDVTTRQTLVFGLIDIFGNLTADPNGNLYGTSWSCGRYGPMVWQYSP